MCNHAYIIGLFMNNITSFSDLKKNLTIYGQPTCVSRNIKVQVYNLICSPNYDIM